MYKRPAIAILIVVALSLIGGGLFWGVRRGNGNTGGHISAIKGQRGTAQVEEPPVQVSVTKFEETPGHYVYKYMVVNGSAFPITDVQIGNDYFNGISELHYAPTGWDGESVPSSSYSSPPGWTFQLMIADEDTVGYLLWSIARPGEAIPGGGSLSGFEVRVPANDLKYETGHWTVFLNSVDDPKYSSVMQSSGVTSVPISSMLSKSDLRIGPNPSRNEVDIRFAVPRAGLTTVDVFDVRGRLVRRVMSRHIPEGEGFVSWDGLNESGTSAASGVYFVRVKTPLTLRFGRITWLHSSLR